MDQSATSTATIAVATDGSHLDPADDRIHAPQDGVARWTENIQWNVRDRAGLGVMWHIGTMLRDARLWHSVVATTIPDGRVLSTKIVAPGRGHFGPAHAELSVVESFRRWQFTFLGGMIDVTPHRGAYELTPDDVHVPVEIELELSAAYPVWIPEGSTEHGDWGRFHHEQTVKVDGAVKIDGTEHRLKGVGHRDHSVGPRDMSALRRDFWGNGVFESGWAFATMFGEYRSASFQRAAVFDASGARSARMLRWTDLETAGGEPRRIGLELDVEGTQKHIEGQIRNGMSFTVVDGAEFAMGTDFRTPSRYMLTNLFCDWLCDGETGIGYLDRGALIALLSKDHS